MTDFEPGALAVATVRGVPNVRVFRVRKAWVYVDSSHTLNPSTYCALYDSGAEVTNVRPLVVIDPEDREQVERLTGALVYSGAGKNDDNHWREVQAALREFANPTLPKPDEPTGLGAVVEDAEGERWVRKGNSSHGEDWTRQIGDAWTGGSWDRIAAVRVLSEGVTNG